MSMKQSIEHNDFMNGDHAIQDTRVCRKDRLSRMLDTVNYGGK